MAKEKTLREYQSSILERIESVKNAYQMAASGHLGVVIGGKNVLIDLHEISETLPVAEIHEVPMVKSWFLGVSNVRGVLYAVNDLAILLGGSPTVLSSNTRLVLVAQSVAANVAFLADRMVGLRSLSMLTKLDESAPESDVLRSEMYLDDDKRIWYVLDFDKLARSKEFAVPYLI